MPALLRRKTYDPAYFAFLDERLPRLREKAIPLWRRRWHGKLEVLNYCLRHGDIDETGLLAEFGVFKGVSIRMIADHHPRRRVWGFDSFEGFPADGRKDWKQNFSTGGAMPRVPANVTLVKGYFDDTLPAFVAENAGAHLALMHIDCDIYSSTRSILTICRPLIRTGTVIVFDELLHYHGFLRNEMAAFWEFLQETGADFEWVAVRGKVQSLRDYLEPSEESRRFMKSMRTWRDAGYHQAAALRITRMP